MRPALLALGLALACAAPTPAARAQARDPLERSLSPLTPEVVEGLRDIARSRPRMRDQVLAKVGDSMTVNYGFMSCFGGDRVDLAGRSHLQATIDHFRRGGVVFERRSLAAGIGWSVRSLMNGGSDSALMEEIFSVFPRFAVVMLGTNDVEVVGASRYGRNMWRLLELMTAQGIVPVVSTVPPRPEARLEPLVVRFNAVVRGLARGLGLPSIDLHAELVRLPRSGLLPGATQTRTRLLADSTTPDACNFTADGLTYGTNVRNLLNLMMLDRLRRHVLDGEPATARAPAPLRGDGTVARPLEVAGVPFSDLRPAGPASSIAYAGCEGEGAGGSERVYRVTLDRPRRLWMLGLSRGGAVPVHVLEPGSGRCVAGRDGAVELELPAGAHHVVVGGPTGEDTLLVIEPVSR